MDDFTICVFMDLVSIEALTVKQALEDSGNEVVALAVRQLEAALKRTEPRPPTDAEGALAALSLSRLSAWLLTVLTHRCATAAAISERLDQLRDGGRSAAEHMAIIDELFGWEQMCQAVASSQLTGYGLDLSATLLEQI